MDPTTAIYGLGACLVAQTVVGLYATYQWRKWQKKSSNLEYTLAGSNAMLKEEVDQREDAELDLIKSQREIKRKIDALFTQRALLFAWVEKAKRAKRGHAHYTAARLLIDEVLSDD